MLRRLLFLCFCVTLSGSAFANQVVKVLSFNIWGAGLHNGRSIDDTVAVLRTTGADIIGLQEVFHHGSGCATRSCDRSQESIACEIARKLAYYCHEQAERAELHGVNAVISRFPFKGTTVGGLGVRIDTGEREVTVFNLHLPDAPYQPYQLAQIPYGDAPALVTAAEATAAAAATRGRIIDLLERDISMLGSATLIITGDFNEPSFRDWTARTASIGRHPLAVEWPATRRIEAMGFVDTYRAIFPDEVDRPGETWTVLPARKEHHDRIDFIFARGHGLTVAAAAVVGEDSPRKRSRFHALAFRSPGHAGDTAAFSGRTGGGGCGALTTPQTVAFHSRPDLLVWLARQPPGN